MLNSNIKNKSEDIRNTFLKFFESKGHRIIPSASLIPYEDPTLLFTNAGMNQFKDVFLGTGSREYTRCANTQKCIRAGGKHNDLEEVGLDGYHHTFFEMLGNWSFGDYYKTEAIRWAWELLTEVWKLPKERLWATVHHTDDEAYNIWKNETDIDSTHILRFGDKDNFWEMGETGPCGPCSEIHIDLTENLCKKEDINANNEEVIEIWNLVFIQYNRDETGRLTPLPKKHIDTGMGFERIVRVLQGKKSNYEIDIFERIINKIKDTTNIKYTDENKSPINAIADHIRCLTFAIADGAIPSNEGRGYVLRRILRRASRLSMKIGIQEPFLFNVVSTIAEIYKDIFPELKQKQDYIENIIKTEEENFNLTLGRGIELFNEIYEKIKSDGKKIFPGEDAFKLYDTYGFPLDLTQVMAKEKGLEVDIEGFDKEMEKQKERARLARKSIELESEYNLKDIESNLNKYNLYYNPYNVKPEGIKTKILDSFKLGDKLVVIVETNPFYSESGGQISDTGKILLPNGKELKVIDVKDRNILIVETNDVYEIPKTEVIAQIDYERREDIQRNHTATHLLHEALRRVLGEHVKQMGSLVSDEYLRFDFPHYRKLTQKEIDQVENIVNEKILAKIDVKIIDEIDIKEAEKIPNVRKFFGDKYEDKVRIVITGEDFSAEFCGGTHIKNTSDIGYFKIIKEESIAAGVRRIIAVTGKGNIKYLKEKASESINELENLPNELTKELKIKFEEFKSKLNNVDYKDTELIKSLYDEYLILTKELRNLKIDFEEYKKKSQKELMKKNVERVNEEIDKFIQEAEHIDGIKYIAKRVTLSNIDELREVGDRLRKKFKSGVGLLATIIDEKINLLCTVGDELIKSKNLNAGKIVSDVASELGGRGGGRPQMATAGAKDKDKLDSILNHFADILKKHIK
ncbi:MAG: alanine--tRNA ligase [Ignavibacteria bacterium]|nr:alanine--tRNA ligase [Ignavibacteria bacterium]